MGLLQLLALSVVMAAASFLAGILPLSLTLSQSQLRLISTVGMGVLVGTSMIVIIPEGIAALYTTPGAAHSHKRGIAHHPALDVRWALHSPEPFILGDLYSRDAKEKADPFAAMPGPVVTEVIPAAPPKTPTDPGMVGALGDETPADPEKEHKGEEEEDENSPHAWIGIALISGFLLMFLIDKVPQYTKPTQDKTQTHHIALNNLGRRFNLTTSTAREEESETFLGSDEAVATQQRGFATTIGLVIHAAADGIALGASSTTAHRELSLIIFFAIMVHKAPAAFGLTSILLKQGLSKRSARGHLVLFSLAAPAGALVTYILASVLGGVRGGSVEGTTFWTGMLLLFSGGTFLYVAMHAMQETSKDHHDLHSHGAPNGFVDGGREAQQAEEKPSLRDLGAAVFGMILPLFLQIGHAH